MVLSPLFLCGTLFINTQHFDYKYLLFKKPSASSDKHVYFGPACILSLLIGSLILRCKTSENMKKENI